jgi:hypothetical protein
MDKRQVILDKYQTVIPESDIECISKEDAKDAMDDYMKECVLLAFEFVAHETTGHSFSKTKDELEFKYKGEWISKEQLFENFL